MAGSDPTALFSLQIPPATINDMCRTIATAIMTTFMLIASVDACADDARLIADITRGVSETRRRIATNCEYRIEILSAIPGSPPSVESHNYAMSRDGFRHESIPVNSKLSASILCYNDTYGFRLARKPPRSQWNITAMEVHKPAEMATRGRAKQLSKLTPEQVGSLSFHFLDVEGVPLDLLVSHPSFKIANTSDTDGKLIIAFNADIESFIGPDRIVQGKLVLLPKSGFVLDEYDVVTHAEKFGNGRATFKSEWANESNPPTPLQQKVIYHPDNSQIISYTNSYKEWDLKQPTPGVFRLTHYGLPEPAITPPPSNRVWYYFASAAAAMLLVSAGFWLRRRNRR